jgi:hypothetical protein
MRSPKFEQAPEWKNWEKLGFESDYGSIKDGVIHPLGTAEAMLAQGFYPKGTKVRRISNAGYPHEADRALEILGDQILTVKTCRIGSSVSAYTFEENGEQWNSVMFKKV